MQCPICCHGSIRVLDEVIPKPDYPLFCDNPDCFIFFQGRGMRFRPPTLPTELKAVDQDTQNEAQGFSRTERQRLSERSPLIERWLRQP